MTEKSETLCNELESVYGDDYLQWPMSAIAKYYIEGLELRCIPLKPKGKDPIKDYVLENDVIYTAEHWEKNPTHGIALLHGPSDTIILDADDVDSLKMLLIRVGPELELFTKNIPEYAGNPERAKFLARRDRAKDGTLQLMKLKYPAYDQRGNLILTHKVVNPSTGDKEEVSCDPDVADAKIKLTHVGEIRLGNWNTDKESWESHYDVLPPSIHPKTLQPYQWKSGKLPLDIPIRPDNWPSILQQVYTKGEETCKAINSYFDEIRKNHSRGGRSNHWKVKSLYNKDHDIEDNLKEYGYTKKSANKWLSPDSSSGIPGIQVFEKTNSCVFYHESDSYVLAKQKDNGKRPTATPFDLFMFFECHNNYSQAINQAAAELGVTLVEETPSQYKQQEDGIYKEVEGKSGNTYDVKICGWFDVKGRMRNERGENWKLVFELVNGDNEMVLVSVPEATLASKNDLYNVLVEGFGFYLPQKNAIELVQYIEEQKLSCKERIRESEKLGWFKDTYLLTKRIEKTPDGESVLYSGDYCHYEEKGTKQEWIDNIGKYCVGNKTLIFACSVQFASMIGELVNQESGGFHLYQQSSAGKQVMFWIVASLSGNPKIIKSTWGTTLVGLEARSKQFSDSTLLLDEIHQVRDYKMLRDVIYMVQNSTGKTRSNTRITAEPLSTFNTWILSAGEISVARFMESSDEIKMTGGQNVRLVDLELDFNDKTGILENTHGMTSEQLVKLLESNCLKYYGSVVRHFTTAIKANSVDKAIEFLRDRTKKFLDTHLPGEVAIQVKRVANRFALCEAATQLARKYGIIDWTEDEIEKSVAHYMEKYCEVRGNLKESYEKITAIKQVRTMLNRYKMRHFPDRDVALGKFLKSVTNSEKENNKISELDSIVEDAKARKAYADLESEGMYPYEIHGWKYIENGRMHYRVFSHIFEQEYCEGLNLRRAMGWLEEEKILKVVRNDYPSTNKKRYLSKMTVKNVTLNMVYDLNHGDEDPDIITEELL